MINRIPLVLFISVNLWIGNPNGSIVSFIPNSYFEVATVSIAL